MTISTTNRLSTSPSLLHSLDQRLGDIFGIKPSDFAVALHRASERTRFAGDGAMQLSPNQAQELRVMAGFDTSAK